MEALVCLAPFGKRPLDAVLTGITNDSQDISVDLIRTVTLPLMKRFGIEEGLELKVQKRGAPPDGGGQIRFQCPIVRSLKPVQWLEEGKIRRIRGIAYATRMSPQTASRVVNAAKGVLIPFQQDIFIYSDHYKGNESGLYAFRRLPNESLGLLDSLWLWWLNPPLDVLWEWRQSLHQERCLRNWV